MGFFTSPRSKKKKKKAALEAAAAAAAAAASTGAPPLFLTVSNDAHPGGGPNGSKSRRQLLKKVNSDSSIVGAIGRNNSNSINSNKKGDQSVVLLDDSSNNIKAFHQSFSVGLRSNLLSSSSSSLTRRKNRSGDRDDILPLSPLNNKNKNKSKSSAQHDDVLSSPTPSQSSLDHNPIKFSPSSTGHDDSMTSLKTPIHDDGEGNGSSRKNRLNKTTTTPDDVGLSPPFTNNDDEDDVDVNEVLKSSQRKIKYDEQQQQQHSASSLSAASVSSASHNNKKLISSLRSLQNSSSRGLSAVGIGSSGGGGGGASNAFDESFVSYVEEFVIEDGDNEFDDRGISLEASYDYIEEVIVEEEGDVGDEENGGGDDDDRRRRIKFDEYDEVQNTIHIEDFTDKEIMKYWYHRNDYDGMIQDAQGVVDKEEQRLKQEQQQSMKEQHQQVQDTTTGKTGIANNRQSLTEFETRGLEAWSTLGKQHVRELKEAAIDAVWDEQQRQSDIGIRDVEQIKQQYQSISLDAQRSATERGLSDQIIAERIRQLDQLSAGIGGESPHKQRLKKLIKPPRPSLLTKSRSVFGKKSTTSSKEQSSRRLHLQSISRTASKRASERNQQTIYRQPSASARVLMDALSNASSQDDEESKPRERRLERSSSTKLLQNVLAVVGGHKTDGRRRRSVQSGCATWEQNTGLMEGGKL